MCIEYLAGKILTAQSVVPLQYSIISMRPNGKLATTMVDLKPNNLLHPNDIKNPRVMGSSEHGYLRHVVWAPVGNGIAFVGVATNATFWSMLLMGKFTHSQLSIKSTSSNKSTATLKFLFQAMVLLK